MLNVEYFHLNRVWLVDGTISAGVDLDCTKRVLFLTINNLLKAREPNGRRSGSRPG